MHAIAFLSMPQLTARLRARIRHAEPQREAKRPQDRASANRRIARCEDAIKGCLQGRGFHAGVEI